jgi:hypothetical protein
MNTFSHMSNNLWRPLRTHDSAGEPKRSHPDMSVIVSARSKESRVDRSCEITAAP